MPVAMRKTWYMRVILTGLFLAGWADIGYSAIRFDVVGSPTEVIHSGRSEVLGSISLIVRGDGSLTGTATGGSTQIGFLFDHPALQIDNDPASGITLFSSPGFEAASPTLLGIENRIIGGRCVGSLTLNLLPGATPADGEFIRIEGIRGRIDTSDALHPGTDLFVDLQSINDPSSVSFVPDRLRVAKSLTGMNAEVFSTAFRFQVRITEGFDRAFVDADAGDDGISINDRTDSGGNALGAPTNSTAVKIRLLGVPAGIAQVVWPSASTTFSGTGARLRLLNSSFAQGVWTATYSFETSDQTGLSDISLESFVISPTFLAEEVNCSGLELAAEVTLAPAEPPEAGCTLPLPQAPRPRFLESYAPLVARLDPPSVVAGNKELVLRVIGSGFVEGATVRWDGSDLATGFVSSSELTAVVPAAAVSEPRTVSLEVVNPVSAGGSRSSVVTFKILSPNLTLFFPLVPAGGADADGIALVNLGPEPADMLLTALDTHGNIVAGDGIANPTTITMNAWQQLALQVNGIFGPGLRQAGAAWIRIEGDGPRVRGFFLSYDRNLTRMDGSEISGNTLTSFIFPEAAAAAVIQIANPQNEPATVEFRLTTATGTLRSISERVIDPGGALAATMSDLFPGASIAPGDYVRAESDQGVVAIEKLGSGEGDFALLNGQDAGQGYETLIAPQYAVGGSDWRTTLSVVNLAPDAGVVHFRFLADDGAQIGPAREVLVAGGGKISIAAQDFFLDAGTEIKQGSVEITGTGMRLSGSVIFGSAKPQGFSAALPLTPAQQSRVLFSQAVSNDEYFTGIAIMNPGDMPLQAVVQLYDREGTVVAGAVAEIPAHGRVSKTLAQYFPVMAENPVQGGRIVIEAIRNLAAFAVFGPRNLSALAAVPPQIF